MASNSFDFPDGTPMLDDQGIAVFTWRQTFQRWHTVVISLQQSGITAERPTAVLWVGRRYFDTTLGLPVWVKSVRPTVWVNGAGVVV